MRAIPQLTAVFRITRPMFLAGANAQFPEFRASSVKGVLRFWWRAAAWTRFPDLETLRVHEDKLFGSASAGRGKISLSALPDLKIGGSVSWHQNSWQNYLGYGMLATKMRPPRAALEGGIFRVILNAVDEASLNDESLQIALRLLGICGGLGAKSRNGWGSVSLIALDPVLDWKTPRSVLDVRSLLAQLLKSDAKRPPFTAISRDTQFVVGTDSANAEQCHANLARLYQNCVAGERQGLRRVSGTPKPDRPQFGLPRNFPQDGPYAQFGQGRRAKPLFMHIHQGADGEPAIPLAVYMPGTFRPGETEIPAGGSGIERFLMAMKPSIA